ncbi:MAG: CDP-alcohol phosphatidyltransferase family protein [Hungatella sp.]|jgi:cardiolipin synthase|nr:CDP-alcohol phosphatidyltransferase family protein [Hungatella sp.]
MNQEPQNKILTIPNMLSALRLCMIPLLVWLYYVKQDYLWTGGLLILSGLTDVVDGFIARRFHMISNLGKVLDPIADKLTQGAMLFCLITRFPFMMAPLVLLILKEIFAGITGFLVIRNTGQVFGANWHGKAATILLFAMMILHVVWNDIPTVLSNILIAVCLVMMFVSLVLYGIRNIWALKNTNKILSGKEKYHAK